MLHKVRSLWLLILLVVAGCSRSDHSVATPPPVVTVPPVVVTDTTGGDASPDDFGIPASFTPKFILEQDENTSMNPQATARCLRVVVPPGLGAKSLEYNMRSAALQSYNKTGHPHEIMVFAYTQGTDWHNAYTAGRLQWAPAGVWTHATNDVPPKQHAAIVDIGPAPKDTDSAKPIPNPQSQLPRILSTSPH
jgi:hypothetical protein